MQETRRTPNPQRAKRKLFIAHILYIILQRYTLFVYGHSINAESFEVVHLSLDLGVRHFFHFGLTFVALFPLFTTTVCVPFELTIVVVLPLHMAVEWVPFELIIVVVFPLCMAVEWVPLELTIVVVLPLRMAVEWVPSGLTITVCCAYADKLTIHSRLRSMRLIIMLW